MSHQFPLEGRLFDVLSVHHWVAVILWSLCCIAPLQRSIPHCTGQTQYCSNHHKQLADLKTHVRFRTDTSRGKTRQVRVHKGGWGEKTKISAFGGSTTNSYALNQITLFHVSHIYLAFIEREHHLTQSICTCVWLAGHILMWRFIHSVSHRAGYWYSIPLTKITQYQVVSKLPRSNNTWIGSLLNLDLNGFAQSQSMQAFFNLTCHLIGLHCSSCNPYSL